MTATSGAREWNTGGLARPPVPPLRWRRVFPGHERELSALRRWLSSLLPRCPERDDVLIVANELASNAIEHTASGRGSRFAVEIIRYPSVVQIAVADHGGSAEPHVIEDPDGEHGRGLLLVRDLSVRTGVAGGRPGRLVWAQCAVARSDVFPAEPGGTWREVFGSDGLPEPERVEGTIACQGTSGHREGVEDGLLGDPRDMAKAGLPEP